MDGGVSANMNENMDEGMNENMDEGVNENMDMDGKPQTVGELEQALFSVFPRADMERWDSCGLQVGERDKAPSRIGVALDFTCATVQAAADEGCDVLVCHHPPYIKDAPCELGPATQGATPGPGRALFEAARLGVSVINMHTNLDRSALAREAFADMLGCTCKGNFEHLLDPRRSYKGTGFGAVLDLPAATTLAQLAAVCDDALGGRARVWGDPDRELERFAYLNGSWRDAGAFQAAIRAHIGCVVVGETGYHTALDVQPHLAVVELGHDISEAPLVQVLFDELAACGYDEGEELVVVGDAAPAWWCAGDGR